MIYYMLKSGLDRGFISRFFMTVTFRAGAALLTGFFLALVGGALFMSYKKYFSARAREYTPSSHEQKDNTPTMGGVFLLGALIMAIGLWSELFRAEVLLFLGCLVGFGAIGFWDDWRKIRGNKGIPEASKFKAQLLVAGLLVFTWYFVLEPSTVFHIPFFTGASFSLGPLLLPWACFILVGASNAVNLTDGLDGLATELLIRNFGVFTLICYWLSLKGFVFLNTSELTVLGAAAVGACLGFLWYNLYPARCFMGDVGSLALGAGLAFMALMIRQELLLALTGLIFVAETLSVFIQVAYYKRFKSRFFKMAPLHHHFELLGLHEVTITGRFSILTSILCISALMIFFMSHR